MNKDLIKGAAILAGVVLVLAVFATVATDNGPQKLHCILRALLHGVAITNIHALCGL